jgi:hypothetical protein
MGEIRAPPHLGLLAVTDRRGTFSWLSQAVLHTACTGITTRLVLGESEFTHPEILRDLLSPVCHIV